MNISRLIAFLGVEEAEGWMPALLDATTHGGHADLAMVPRTSIRRGTASVGGVGRGAPVEVDGIIVAIDGLVYEPECTDARATARHVAGLFRSHGIQGALDRIEGDFTLALYDQKSDTLHVARDRFGVKPAYWAKLGAGVAVASRLRPLLLLPGVDRRPDARFLACFAGSHYRTFDNEAERSPYRGVEQLPAGHRLEVRGTSVQVHAWYRLTEQPEHTASEAELAAEYRARLCDAVQRRRRVTHDDAFTLSGGMDSSSVLACAVHLSGQKAHAYSSTYADETYDETEEIRTMLDNSVEKWHPVRIEPPNLALVVPRMIDANDEPIATATWLSHFVLCERVHEDGFSTLYGGLGGDELNAGEYEYFYYFFADLRRRQQEELLRKETAKWVEYHDHPVFKKSASAMEAGLTRLVDLERPGVCLPDSVRLGRYVHAVRPEVFDLASYVPVMDHPFTSYLKNRTYQDIFRETAPCCLRAADRQTAAFGLDVIWPFFDHRLVEFMFRVPGTLKIRDGVTKHLLREAMRGILPEETRTRIKKTGWNAPAHMWFSGQGQTYLRELIESPSFAAHGVYDRNAVRRLLDEHEEIVRERRLVDNHMMFFWQLVNVESWLTWLEALPILPVRPRPGA